MNFSFMFRGRLHVEKGQKCKKNDPFFVISWKMHWSEILKMFSVCKMKFKGHPLNSKLIIRSRIHKNIWTFWQNLIFFTWRRPSIISFEFKRWPWNLIYIRKQFPDFRSMHFSGNYNKKCHFFTFLAFFYMKTASKHKSQVHKVAFKLYFSS